MHFFSVLLSLFVIFTFFVDHGLGQKQCRNNNLSVSSQVNNGKYVITINGGECIYRQGKVIDGDTIRAMTSEEHKKIQQYLNGQIDLPYFCSC